METGRVSWASYYFFLLARGIVWSLVMVLSYAVYMGLSIESNFWLKNWSGDQLLLNSTNDPEAIRERTNYYMSFYAILCLGQAVMITIFAFVDTISSIRGSFKIHENMLHSLLRAPMAFFDTTPIGRIINRFSKDMETIDHVLPGNIYDFIDSSMAVLSSVIVISISTPYFLIVLVLLSVVYIAIQTYYIPASRQARRLDAVTRSPIYQLFTESINGAPVIRAFRQTERFFKLCNTRIDANARFFFLKVSSNRWLGFRLDMIGCLVVLGAIVMAVIERDKLTAGSVGLSISYALQVTDNLNWMVLYAGEIETNAVAVERTQEYLHIEQESQWVSQTTRISSTWPSQGHIRFRNYSARYRPGHNLVLNHVDMSILPGQTVGIVGRTGAGKSSLSLSLFRLIEAATGAIEIDGVNIADLGLHQLRGRLTILPQDSILFSGTLRDNLDPFGLYSDDNMWHSLRMSHLVHWVTDQGEGLCLQVGEGGSKLSVGQRQLVCLARALLRRSRILVLDEATASVDLETDRLVMDTIKENFKESTILIIAHRLSDVLNADRVVVLDRGYVREFDTPEKLMNNRGLFYSLMESYRQMEIASEQERSDLEV